MDLSVCCFSKEFCYVGFTFMVVIIWDVFTFISVCLFIIVYFVFAMQCVFGHLGPEPSNTQDLLVNVRLIMG